VVVVLLPLALLGGPWTIAAAFAAGSGIVVHEAAHAVALHGVPRALVLDGLRPSILHPPVGARRTFVAAVAGPLAPTLVALAVALGWRSAAPAVVPLAAHVLGLTVIAPDGSRGVAERVRPGAGALGTALLAAGWRSALSHRAALAQLPGVCLPTLLEFVRSRRTRPARPSPGPLAPRSCGSPTPRHGPCRGRVVESAHVQRLVGVIL
jgi:hypothetical protein